MEAVHHNHCVFRFSYHLVLVVKYRRKCITPEIGDLLTAKAGEFLASRRKPAGREM